MVHLMKFWALNSKKKWDVWAHWEVPLPTGRPWAWSKTVQRRGHPAPNHHEIRHGLLHRKDVEFGETLSDPLLGQPFSTQIAKQSPPEQDRSDGRQAPDIQEG